MVVNSDLKWPSTITTNPSVGGLSARGAFFGAGSSIEKTGLFIGDPRHVAEAPQPVFSYASIPAPKALLITRMRCHSKLNEKWNILFLSPPPTVPRTKFAKPFIGDP